MVGREGFVKITPQKLHDRLAAKEDFVLLDTLTNAHFKRVHLPGAKNACVFEVTFLDQVAGIVRKKDQDMVVYGSSEKTMDALTAAEKLVRKGYGKVSILEGGIRRWRAAGFELEGENPEIPTESENFPALEDGTYSLDLERSVIEWTGRNPNTKHYGTLGLSRGEITVREKVVGGHFEIDMKSIRNINLEGDPLQPVLISHLMSDDFFFVKIFPGATFTLGAVTPVENPSLSSPNFDVKGILELRGLKKEIAFPATANVLDDGKIGIEAHFDIDRTRWKIIYGSSRFFEHLGMHLVYDLISIQVRIVAG